MCKVSLECFPYKSGNGKVPKCITTCKDGKSVSISKYYSKRGSLFRLKNETAIMNEIYTNGPVEAVFRVYQDFFSYESGVYSHFYGGEAGLHSIKIIGWAHDDKSKKDYWIISNS